jgi:hypothetical protein
MSKAKSSAIATEVSTAVEASVENTEVVKAKRSNSLEKGVKEKMVEQIKNAIANGVLKFEATENPNIMVATSPNGVKYEMTLIEKDSERATISGKSVTCQIVGRKFDEEGKVLSRTAILNGREIWTQYNPEYKFPSKSGKAKVDPNKPKRIAKPKAPSVVHSIDDMI